MMLKQWNPEAAFLKLTGGLGAMAVYVAVSGQFGFSSSAEQESN